ncbi:MAG: hypothetical protein AB7S38_11990 [Vulcanimicrobiota bacterium]
MMLLLAVPVCGWLVVRRLLHESSPLLALALTGMLSCLTWLSLANLSLATSLSALPFALAIAYLGKRTSSPPPLEKPDFSWPTTVFLTWVGMIIFGYTAAFQNLYLEDDYWIHFPLMGLLKSDGLPVLHPFFAEIEMHGHYGRDLLVATLARLAHAPILPTLFWSQILMQLCSLLSLIGLTWRSTRNELSTCLAVLFVFVGINVGGRGGLMDCFQNNNSFAYAVTLTMLHLVFLVYDRATTPRIVTAGLCLGVFALVYETHFGLVGLVLLGLVLATRRREFAAIGALGLVLAAVAGGPITHLVQERLHPTQREWTPGELNQHQVIKLTFPKKELFQIQLAYGSYQRKSCAYAVLPALDRFTTIAAGTPYRPIWSWDVLMIHWLPTLLAPLSLLVLARSPPNPLGLAFLGFGAVAFLTPALVHFGPIYEFEYFRWQFAAGFGFAAAFGMAAGLALKDASGPLKVAVVVLLVSLEVAPSLLLFVLPLGRDLQARGSLADLVRPRSQVVQLGALGHQLGNFNYIDYVAARTLKKMSEPGQNLIVNASCGSSWDLFFESTLIALSGRRSVGHSLPWPQEPVGTPPYHRSLPAHAFWVAPSETLLGQLQVDFVYLRPGADQQFELRRWFDSHCDLAWAYGDYRIWRTGVPHQPLRGVAATKSQVKPPKLRGIPEQLPTADPFEFSLESTGQTWAWAIVPAEAGPEAVDLHEVVSWVEGPCLGVTPPVAGAFELRLFEVKNGLLYPTDEAVRLEVRERIPPGP